jgi:hypothetical protein
MKHPHLSFDLLHVMIPPCPQPESTTDGSIAPLKRQAHDFACQQTMNDNDYEDDEDNHLAIGHLVVT